MGLGSHNHQVVNFFHLVGALAPVKQLRNVCIRHHYLGASETSSSRGYGGGVCPRKTHRVLHSYIRGTKCENSHQEFQVSENTS